MLVATGAVCLVIGLVGWGGQLLSVTSWPSAKRLGLQEADEHADPLFQRLERNTAAWDLFTWWTLPAAGTLMLLDHAWWPYLAVLAGGVFVDTSGRELAKLWGLEREGIRTGTAKDRTTRLAFFIVTGATGAWAAVLAIIRMV
jgi:hypothetical protein